MGLRYPLAALAGYIIFLGLIRLWIAYHRHGAAGGLRRWTERRRRCNWSLGPVGREIRNTLADLADVTDRAPTLDLDLDDLWLLVPMRDRFTREARRR